GDATGNSAVVAPRAAHDLVAFELNRAGVDSHLRRETTKSIRQPRRVPDGEIWFRGRPEVVKGLQIPKARLRYQGPAIVSHAANRFGDPRWIAREQFVVFRGAQEADDAQFDDKVVDDLLRLFLC